MYTIECAKDDKYGYWGGPSVWHYVTRLEVAERIAREHSKKAGRKFVYTANIVARNITIVRENGDRVPMNVGTSTAGDLTYSADWIKYTTASAVVDGRTPAATP